jgi:hypothetical protein
MAYGDLYSNRRLNLRQDLIFNTRPLILWLIRETNPHVLFVRMLTNSLSGHYRAIAPMLNHVPLLNCAVSRD